MQFDIPHVVEISTFSYADWKQMARIAESLKCNLTFLMWWKAVHFPTQVGNKWRALRKVLISSYKESKNSRMPLY